MTLFLGLSTSHSSADHLQKCSYPFCYFFFNSPLLSPLSSPCPHSYQSNSLFSCLLSLLPFLHFILHFFIAVTVVLLSCLLTKKCLKPKTTDTYVSNFKPVLGSLKS